MLTIDEKARLAFHYLASGQPGRANDLQESISTKQYALRDLDFTSTLSSSILFAHAWSTEYWKNLAIKQTENAKYFYDVLQGNPVLTSAELAERLADFEGKALAIDAALVATCQKFGICPDDVRRMAANAAPYEATSPDAKIDQAYLAELLGLYEAMLASWPMNALQKSEVGQSIH